MIRVISSRWTRGDGVYYTDELYPVSQIKLLTGGYPYVDKTAGVITEMNTMYILPYSPYYEYPAVSIFQDYSRIRLKSTLAKTTNFVELYWDMCAELIPSQYEVILDV